MRQIPLKGNKRLSVVGCEEAYYDDDDGTVVSMVAKVHRCPFFRKYLFFGGRCTAHGVDYIPVGREFEIPRLCPLMTVKGGKASVTSTGSDS